MRPAPREAAHLVRRAARRRWRLTQTAQDLYGGALCLALALLLLYTILGAFGH